MNYESLEFVVVIILSSMFVFILTYKMIYEHMLNRNKFGDLEYHPFLLMWKLFLHLIKNNFDSLSFISNILQHKRIRYLYGNLLLTRFVLVLDHDIIKELLTDEENIDRPLVNYGLKNSVEGSILLRNGKKWKVQRQQLLPIFTTHSLKSFIPEIEKQSKNLLLSLYKVQPEWIDITPIIKRCFFEMTIDILWEFSETSCLRNFSMTEQLAKNGIEIFIEKIFNIFLWSDTIYSFTSNGKNFQKDLISYKKLLKKEIEDKLKNGFSEETKYEFFPGSILRSLLENRFDFTIENAVDELLAFMFAAFHTTAMTFCWSLYEIGQHQDIQRKIQKELFEIFENDVDREITINDLTNMNYLECVLKEVLRMYPGIPFTTRRCNFKRTFGSDVFPENTIYIIPIFHIHRLPEYFLNPEVFQPERFLPENSINIHPFSYLPFSFGPRYCPGNKFAILEMKICLATILRKFCIESYPEKCVPIGNGLALSSKSTIYIKLFPRV